MRFKAVLFDLDGTLFDTAPDIMASCNYTLKAFGYDEVPEELLRTKVTAGMRAMMSLRVPQFKWPELMPGTPMYETFSRHYTEHVCERTAPFDGIPELVENLNKLNVATAVISNKYSRMIVPLFKRFNFTRSFQAVLGGDSTRHSKPHPEPLLTALNTLKIAPADAIYCGDFITDIEAAHNAGCTACAVKWGYGERSCGAIETWNADLIATKAKDILDAVTA